MKTAFRHIAASFGNERAQQKLAQQQRDRSMISLICIKPLGTHGTFGTPPVERAAAARVGSSGREASTSTVDGRMSPESFRYTRSACRTWELPLPTFECHPFSTPSLKDVESMLAPVPMPQRTSPVQRQTVDGPRDTMDGSRNRVSAQADAAIAPSQRIPSPGAVTRATPGKGGATQGGWLHDHWVSSPAGVAALSGHVDTAEATSPPIPPPPPAPPAFPAAQVGASPGGMLADVQRAPLTKSRSLDAPATVSLGSRPRFGGTLPAELLRKIAERRAIVEPESDQRAVDTAAVPRVVHAQRKGAENVANRAQIAFTDIRGPQIGGVVTNDLMTELREKLAARASQPSG